MTSAERVLAAIDHQEPDRVPVDFWWSVEMKGKLLRHLGLRTTDELQTHLGSDIRGVYPAYVGPELKRFEDGSFEDFWGVIRSPFSYETGGTYYEVMSPALAEATSLDEIEQLRWPSPDWFDYESLVRECDRYQGHAIMVGKMGRECQTLFIQLWYYRGLKNILMDLVAWPDMVEALVARIMEFRIEHLKRILAVAAGRAHILQIADDYGAQGGLMMSRDAWLRFFAPHLKTMASMAHEAGLKVFLHSDGDIRPIIPDLIDLGIDILNPIQPGAGEMDPAGLKRDYGDRLCFHGAVDTQTTLPFGTEEDVIAEVRERINVLGEGGGYILAPVHTVEPDVPVENLLAVYRAARQYGVYR